MNRIFIVESRSETDSTDCAGSSDNDTDYVPFNEMIRLLWTKTYRMNILTIKSAM